MLWSSNAQMFPLRTIFNLPHGRTVKTWSHVFCGALVALELSLKEMVAINAVTKAARDGHWVVLQNIHLMQEKTSKQRCLDGRHQRNKHIEA